MVSKKYIEDTQIHVFRAKKNDATRAGGFGGSIEANNNAAWKNKYNPSLLLAYTIADVLDAKIDELFIIRSR